jgi:perosamine synthetase
MAGGQECLLDVGMDLPHLLWQQAFKHSFDLVIVPHMYGIPAKWAYQTSVKIIEDCAQSIGAMAGGVYCGLSGDIGIYSFYATKLMTSGGQGGMLVSRDKSLVDAARDYREFDCRTDRKCRFNFQMTDLQAAIGRTQLKKLPVLIERRQVIFNRYKSSSLKLIGAEIGDEKTKPVRFRAIWVQPRPREVMKRLAEMGIRSIIPLEDWELLGPGACYPHAHWWTQNTLSLPLYPSLTDAEVDYIIKSVNKVRHELNI